MLEQKESTKKKNLLNQVPGHSDFLSDYVKWILKISAFILLLLRSAMAGRLYKLQSKHTSNSDFDQTFKPCSGYILFAAEQRVGYQISLVDLQREVNCP